MLTYGGIAVALLMSHGGISIAPVAFGGFVMGLLAYGGEAHSLLPAAGPDASAFAVWFNKSYFETKLPVVTMVVANLFWVIPVSLMLIFGKKIEKKALEEESSVS